jgi:cell wall-associated NlpC family hydrolase
MSSLSIPIHFFDTYYDGSKFPGSSTCGGIQNGANCQYFAYELLRHFGFTVPDLRSSNLWKDKISTKKVKTLQPLDLVLFNKTKDAYGAHVGVYIGNGKVIHLSKEVGYSTVWDFEEFKKRENYKVFIGAKRVRNSPHESLT